MGLGVFEKYINCSGFYNDELEEILISNSYRMATRSNRLQTIHVYQFHNLMRLDFHAGRSHWRSLYGDLSHTQICRMGYEEHSLHYIRYLGNKRDSGLSKFGHL